MNRLRTKLEATLRPAVGLMPSRRTKKSATRNRVRPFNPKIFLVKDRHGTRTLQAPKGDLIFAQGDRAETVFYILAGRITLTVVSRRGKEAVLAQLKAGDFFGEGCLAEQPVYMATASAEEDSSIVRIDKQAMIHMLHHQPGFAKLFITHLLSRNVRIQREFLDHLFDSADKRLARALLLLARYGKDGEPERNLPKVSQETLAEMAGTTRSQIRIFLAKFTALGFIKYSDTIEVHHSLLNIVLHD